MHKPRIAVFDYSIRPDSAMGGCHLRMLEGLAEKYDFTVFAVDFENPVPSRIKSVRIPALKRPTILLFVVFHLLAPLYYYMYRLKNGVRFDLVERMEVFTVVGSVAYIHFCHRAYLKKRWAISRQRGVRGLLLGLDHVIRAYLVEPLLYRFATTLLVPSGGLARELIDAYPFTKRKIYLIPNSADYPRLSSVPVDFDRHAFRGRLGFSSEEIVLLFIALGQFERKGLPQLLEAIALVAKPHIKLLVVGGSPHWIEHYRVRAKELKICEQIVFVGMQRDMAPFYWAGDVLTLPSFYEIFPLVVLEAAAAGCPPLVTHLYGVEEYIVDGTSGVFVDRTPASIANGIRAMEAMGPEGRSKLGKAAQRAASQYSVAAFVSNWDKFLTKQLGTTQTRAEPPPREADHAQS